MNDHKFDTTTLTIAESGHTSDAFAFGKYLYGQIRMPAAWTAASIGFKVSNTEDGTFLPLYDHDGNLVQIDSPSVDGAYQIPTALVAAGWVKLWSQNGSGTNTAQAAERSIIVDIKS